MKNILHWAPRIIGILAIIFISSFALDTFQAGVPLVQLLLGLVIHLIPSAVLVALLVLAWRFERIGGSIFVLLSFVPFFLLSNQVWVNALLAAPFFLTGVLFLVSWYSTARSTKASGEES